jgi:hypothetical protein
MSCFTGLVDMSKLFKVMNSIQEDFKCPNCQQFYKRKWCYGDAPCLFCRSYLPMANDYTSILRDLDWQYLKSGEYDRQAFYTEFLDNLKKWATRFSVRPNKEDLKLEEELRDIKNWTRNEPDCDYYY